MLICTFLWFQAMHVRRQRGWVQRVEERRSRIGIRQRLRLGRRIVQLRPLGRRKLKLESGMTRHFANHSSSCLRKRMKASSPQRRRLIFSAMAW